MTVGELIKRKRKEKGLTQDELAKMLGVSRPAVCQFEKETAHPRFETLQKIADALDVPVYEFSFNEGERIKAIRETKGLSQDMLADKLGLTSSQINEIEERNSRPSNNVLIQLASALEVPYSDLVPLPSSIEVKDDKGGIQKIDQINALWTIVQYLCTCDVVMESTHCDTEYPDGFYFSRDNHPFVFTNADFYDLVPLVDSLVRAYIDHKKKAL